MGNHERQSGNDPKGWRDTSAIGSLLDEKESKKIERIDRWERDRQRERKGEAMVVGGAVGAPYYREIKGSNSSRDFY
jgi:hypothetical protein